jgi:hypothetical protein
MARLRTSLVTFVWTAAPVLLAVLSLGRRWDA